MAALGVQARSRLGRYELLARLATGGMGEIFLARLQGAAGFEKLYVVKRILPHLADDARFRQMLIAEARIAAKMSHANICQVYELGETDGQLYIAMEYLDGITMLPLLRKASKDATPLDFGFVGAIAQMTCDALHYAHELKEHGEVLGIVHRDVTPSNIFITESGIAKVLDFGIAKAKGASTNTQEGTVKGKYAYMAPEQLRGAAIDRRVDVFALGVVLYEMLALRRLFQRKTDYLTFRAVMEQPIPDVRRYRPDVPEALAAALGRALDREPGNRFDTARQFGTAVIDAISKLKRPWTQGEIGDFVHANFADELGRRGQQVAIAVQRTAAGSPSVREAMPMIAQSEDEASQDTEDDGFPSVETDDDANPLVAAALRDAAEFQSVTPPPFAGDSATSSAALPAVRGRPPSGRTSSGAQRGLVWPMVAVAGIAVAAAALFLVWKQMQDKAPPTEIRITQEHDGEPARLPPQPASVKPSIDEPAVAASDGAGDRGSGAAVASDAGSKPNRRPRTGNAYQDVIEGEHERMTQCLRDHQDPKLPRDGKVTIDIAATGKPRAVSLQPAAIDSAPLGECIRNVMMRARFPKAAGDVPVTFTISQKT